MSLMPTRAGDSRALQNASSPARQDHGPRPAKRLAFSFAIASLLAVGAGCAVAVSAGFGNAKWAPNALAWMIGASLSRPVARIRPEPLFRAVLLLTPLALLIGLFSPGVSGVHRWIALGPLHWNVAFLCLPAATVAFAAFARNGSRWTWWAAPVIQAVLCLQPDASQATAFAAAGIAGLLAARSRGRSPFAAGLSLALAAVFAWTRPDPLAPLPEVEGIIRLASAQSTAMAALCIASLAAVTASPLFARNLACADAGPPALALFVYFLTSSLMPLFSAFPVPLVGMGMSPILGFWLGISALMTVCDPSAPAR